MRYVWGSVVVSMIFILLIFAFSLQNQAQEGFSSSGLNGPPVPESPFSDIRQSIESLDSTVVQPGSEPVDPFTQEQLDRVAKDAETNAQPENSVIESPFPGL